MFELVGWQIILSTTLFLPPGSDPKNTITQVIQYCLAEPAVSEVIVVDDKSEDNTAILAKQAGAKVIISASRGKGISMKEGIDAAANEMIVFLDADIDPYPEKAIHS